MHQALLAGLLSHLGFREGSFREGSFRDGGFRDGGAPEYRGAHGSKFMIGRGSVLSSGVERKTMPSWVIAAELVETDRLWGRRLAAVQPEWAESLGSHLAKYSYGEPHWDSHRGGAVCSERVSLFGLPIVAGRTIGYDRVNHTEARELFIRCALVEGDWNTAHVFWEHNQRFLADLEGWGERVRRHDLIDEDAVFRFYDERVGPEAVTTRHFDRWWKVERVHNPQRLHMRMDDFVSGDGIAVEAFPTTWHVPSLQNALPLAVTYRFDPTSPLDGATVHMPIAVLNQVEPVGFDWGVPGFRADLIGALLKSLPKQHRREMVPMAEVIEKVVAAVGAPHSWEDGTSLASALTTAVIDVTGIAVSPTDFDADKTPSHLRLTFAVDDEQGATLATGKDLLALRKLLAPRLRVTIARQAAIEERTGIAGWDFGELPKEVTTPRADLSIRGYPALLDDGTSVSIRVFTNPELQAKVMRNGVRRLLLLTVPVSKRAIERDLTAADRLALARGGDMSAAELADDCLTAASDRVIVDHGELPFTGAQFDQLVSRARDELADRAATALAGAAEVVVIANAVNERLARLVAPAVAVGAADARAQLARLVRPGFVTAAGLSRLSDLLRYVKGIDHRLHKLPENTARDAMTLRSIAALEQRYVSLLRRFDRDEITAEVIDLGWLLEELRVSLFAQQLGTSRSVSLQRVAKQLAALGG
ncbi:MAG: DUF3418 domain-containing protein [Actinobacteria bacterium]|nr:DUF3418 domain-containing protein [Actinomycetota bacterium]